MSTRICQPAVLTHSVAAWRVAAEHGIEGGLAMGHSLGEYSALVACGSLSFEEALRLVEARGVATTDVVAAHPGSMAALLGASDEDVEALCLEAGEVWPANYNCPGQVVASGLHRGVDRLMDLARARGIKAKLLDVDGAFHSSVMAPAAEKLRESLSGVKINTPSLPFLSATSAAFEKGDRLRSVLAQQLTAPVRFTQTVRMALDHGVNQFVEFGHRRVLVGAGAPHRARRRGREPGRSVRPPGPPGARRAVPRAEGAGRARHRGEQGDRSGMCGGPRRARLRRRVDVRDRP